MEGFSSSLHTRDDNNEGTPDVPSENDKDGSHASRDGEEKKDDDNRDGKSSDGQSDDDKDKNNNHDGDGGSGNADDGDHDRILPPAKSETGGNCNTCNRKFCLSYNLPICKNTKEEEVFTTCFRQSTPFSSTSPIFIFPFLPPPPPPPLSVPFRFF